MCTPALMVGLAISSAQAVIGYQAESAAADVQNEMYRQNALNANQSAINQYNDVALRRSQEQEAAGQKKIETARDARAAAAETTVSAGTAGVSGLSVQGLLQEIMGREGTANASIDRNLQMTEQQLTNQMKGIEAETTNRINSVQRAPKPSFLNAGLQIGASALGAYNQYKNPTNT